MDRTVERMKKRERRINQNKDGDRQASKQASKVRCKMGGVEVSKMWPIEAEDGI